MFSLEINEVLEKITDNFLLSYLFYATVIAWFSDSLAEFRTLCHLS